MKESMDRRTTITLTAIVDVVCNVRLFQLSISRLVDIKTQGVMYCQLV